MILSIHGARGVVSSKPRASGDDPEIGALVGFIVR